MSKSQAGSATHPKGILAQRSSIQKTEAGKKDKWIKELIEV